MGKKQYVLTVDMVFYDKTVSYPIVTSNLVALQKYISFCNGPSELIWTMPNEEAFSVRNYITEHLKVNFEDRKDPFNIKTDSLKGKSIRKIYKADIDVLLATPKEIKERILDYFSISINDCINHNIPKETEDFLQTLYKKYFNKGVKDAIDYFRLKKLNMDSPERYDSRYEIAFASDNSWMILGLYEDCIKELVNGAFKDDKKRFDLAFLLKEKTGNLLPYITKEEKEQRLKEIEGKLSKKKVSTTYIRNSIRSNIRMCNETFSVNLIALDEKNFGPLTGQDIINYNKKRLTDRNCGPEFKETLDLIEKIETLRSELLIIQEDEKEFQKICEIGSFTIDPEQAKKKLNEIKEDKKNKLRQIEKLEFTLQQIEEGSCVFSDAGFIVEKDKIV